MKLNRLTCSQFLFGLLGGWLFLSTDLFSDSTHHTHSAHVHGEAELYIVYEHGKLFIEFISPAINLIGFEHPPENEKQQHKLTQAKQILTEGSQLFTTVPPNCRLETANASAPYLEKAPHTEHHHPEGEHPDFHASYTFNCQANTKLTAIHTALMVKFPDIEHIKVRWILQNQQGSTHLTADHATISFN